MTFLWFIIIGIVAGCIAAIMTHSDRLGWTLCLLAGIGGGILGGWLFELFDIMVRSIIFSLLSAVVGAIILIILFKILELWIRKR